MNQHDVELKASLARRVIGYRERLALIDARMAEWAAERGEIEKRRARGEALYASEFGEPVPQHPVRQTSTDGDRLFLQPVESSIGPLTSLRWDEAIAHVLRGHAYGLHVRAIWDQLKHGAFQTDARDPIRSIVAIALRRPDVFVRTGPNTYGLVGEVVEAISVSREVAEQQPQSLEVE